MKKKNLTHILLASVLLSLSALSGAQPMPVPVMEVINGNAKAWKAAQPTLRDAIECRKPLKHTAEVRSVFRSTNNSLDGDHAFPEPLQVFGTLNVSSVAVFEGGEEEGNSYTVEFKGMKLADVAKAAKLRKERQGSRYIREVKGGHLEADEINGKGVQLSCILGGYSDD